MRIINSNVSFISKQNPSSVEQYRECLLRFSENFDSEVSLKTDTPIILDTNVLLRYYSISFIARDKLFEFIKANSGRVFLTSQIQREFIKNREDVIQRFFDQVTSKIPKDYNSEVVNRMNSFLEQHKVVLKDYPFVETGINKYKKELENLLKKLNETSEKHRKEQRDLLVRDKLLDLLTKCKLLPQLEPEELDQITRDFDLLSKNLPSDTTDSWINKVSSIFPGAGDVKHKIDDPYGDYIIYHEVMKFMVESKTNAIFLTFDTTKGDWMSKTKSPYLHYVQNMFSNTGYIFFIVDAERALGQLLNVEIESLLPSESLSYNFITKKSVASLIGRHPIFSGLVQPLITDDLIKELGSYYSTIQEIEIDLDKGQEGAIAYRNEKVPNLNAVGMLRSCLRIANPSIDSFVSHGNFLKLSQEFLNEIEPYRPDLT